MAKCCEFCGRGIEGFKRNTRKYCDDNCKQLAYYARQGMTWGKNELSGKSDLSLNVKSDFTLSDKGHADSEEKTFVAHQTITPQTEKQAENVKPAAQPKQNAPVRQPYCKVESALLLAIDRNRDRFEKYFSCPEQFWTRDAIACAKWVTIRVRCLLENILRLSRLGYTDLQTIKQLSGALNDLTEAVDFRAISAFYPFAEFVLDLKMKFQGMLGQIKVGRVSFHLSPERKAQFMAYRFIVADFVPKCKFSELDFSDGIKAELRKEFEARTRKEGQDDDQ